MPIDDDGIKSCVFPLGPIWPTSQLWVAHRPLTKGLKPGGGVLKDTGTDRSVSVHPLCKAHRPYPPAVSTFNSETILATSRVAEA
jgi:hypothetical protein